MTIRLGGGQGFYGDGLAPVADLMAAGVDYLICEALAELTLAILQKDRQRDESLGYTRDLPRYLQAALPSILQGSTRLITNAGGINPIAAGRAVIDAARAAGAAGSGLKIATVVGDDLRPRAEDLQLPGAADALFANVYIGARPIVEALDRGANIVITGRVADASLFAAPLVREFGWDWDDWDRLAAGVAIGHLLECSGQVTGGNYSGRWWDNPDPDRIAFPIAEVQSDGSAVITKPGGTGGMVTFDTVREQLLYEVHDPAAYLNPDVVADFTSLRLEDLGGDRVRVSGITGRPAPSNYKGLLCTPAGWAGECRITYTWPDAEAKAQAALGYIRRRSHAAGIPVEEWCEEYFGVNAFGGPTVCVPDDWQPPEVTGRLAWRTATAEDAARPATDVGVLGLSGPPGISGMGRPAGSAGKPTQLLAVDPFYVDREIVDAQVRVDVEEL
jgi:Acyclic terpene utilisation family protein AtuA